jgi:integrase
MDARAALTALEGSGMTLEQAALRAVGLRGQIDPQPVSRMIDGFIRRSIRKNLSPATTAFYQTKLDVFADTFGDRVADSVTRPEIRAWIEALPVSPATAQGYARAISVCFSWATKQEPPIVSKNPATGINDDAAKTERRIDILTPAEAEQVMRSAGTYAPMLALMLFAGVRPSEIRSQHKPPLLWRQVDTENRIIRINADQSKTRTGRPLEGLPENLWQWLQPGKSSSPVAPGRSRQATRIAKAAIGRWSQDVCRHSFFTYHLALYGDISRTMLIAGHESGPGMMYQHYRGVATKAEAEAYFAIEPETLARTI